MSTQQPGRSPSGPPRQPQGPQSSGAGAAFDPLKLLQKYKYVLVGAIVAGAVIGFASHIFLRTFFPGYTATVLFKCSPVETEIQTIATATIDEDEMARFMGTQVQTIKGERVIEAVLNDPRLEAQAPNWYRQFSRNGNLDIVDAYEELEDIIKTYSLPNTYLIKLSVEVRDANDAAGLVRLLKENYISQLGSSNNSNITKRKEAIRSAITDADEMLEELSNRKSRLVQDNQIQMIDPQTSVQSEMLRYVNAQIINTEQQIEAFEVLLKKDEAQLQRNTGIEYDAILRERIEQMPQMLTLQQQIIAFKAELLSLQAEGIQPQHRTYRLVLNRLEANERKLADTRENLLSEAFESRVESTRLMLSQFRAQIADLSTQQEGLQIELNELTLTAEEIEDLDRQIEHTLTMKAEHTTNLAELRQAAGLYSANRITVDTPESVPDRPSFPLIYVMVPAGVFLGLALTVGAIVIFEMLDQRVKSAADIAMIPRTRPLGIIPDAEEDPTEHRSIETLFSDTPNSVLAEHYRQLRTRITKEMDNHGHKTLLVAGAMPGSGATSVATNLAQACVAAGKKTLLIDTNFRRSRVHTAFGLLESPGLAETLADPELLLKSIQKTTSTGPDVLSAGSKNLRIVERLGTQAMGIVLAQASTEYDIIILDVAPAIVAGDATMLSNQVDATMLVVRAMNEKRGQVARLKNELSDSRSEFLGVLVNGVRSAAGGYMRKNIRTSHQYHVSESGSDAGSGSGNAA